MVVHPTTGQHLKNSERRTPPAERHLKKMADIHPTTGQHFKKLDRHTPSNGAAFKNFDGRTPSDGTALKKFGEAHSSNGAAFKKILTDVLRMTGQHFKKLDRHTPPTWQHLELAQCFASAKPVARET